MRLTIRLLGTEVFHIDTEPADDDCSRDRCGARAAHRVEFTAGELLFCAHHYREHKDRLPQPFAAASGQTGE